MPATATAEETADSAETQEVVADAPAPFGGEAVKIAVVSKTVVRGDYFQQWTKRCPNNRQRR